MRTTSYQHDLDARPIYTRHEIPLLDMTTLETDPQHRRAAMTAVTGLYLIHPQQRVCQS